MNKSGHLNSYFVKSAITSCMILYAFCFVFGFVFSNLTPYLLFEIFILSDMNGCYSRPCQNQGECVKGDDAGYTCKCQAGWTGVNCEISKFSRLNKECIALFLLIRIFLK